VNKLLIPRPRQTENYAEIYITAGQTAQEIPEYVDSYTKVINFTHNGHDKRCVADGTNNKITIYKPGYYQVGGSFSFSSLTDSVKFLGAAFLAGAICNNIMFSETLATKTLLSTVGFTGFIEVTTTVDLDFRVRHYTAATVSITIEYGNLNCLYIGGI